jgi:hypothetical protein
MSPIRNVSDLRTEAHRNGADRAAIRYSIIMALIGLVAVALSTLLPSADKPVEPPSSAAEPAAAQVAEPKPTAAQVAEPKPATASPEPMPYPQNPDPMMSEKLEMAFH